MVRPWFALRKLRPTTERRLGLWLQCSHLQVRLDQVLAPFLLSSRAPTRLQGRQIRQFGIWRYRNCPVLPLPSPAVLIWDAAPPEVGHRCGGHQAEDLLRINP